MKLAEKLAAMSNEQQTMEETVTNEIINFFVNKFENGEIMERFEKKLSDTVLHNRKVGVYVEFWKYIPGCFETHFSLLGEMWNPENPLTSVYKGVDLCIIYKNVLEKMTSLARDYFEKEGFTVEINQDPHNKRYVSYIITISW